MSARDELHEQALLQISREQRAPAPDRNPRLLATALMLSAWTAAEQSEKSK